MRLTIKGITPSTLTLNTLGIIIRGDSKVQAPGSVARNIDIKNEAQLTEINSLVRAGFIRIENEDAPVVTPKPIVAERVVKVEEEVEEEVEEQVCRGKGRPKGSKGKKTLKAEALNIEKGQIKRVAKSSEEESSTVFVVTDGGVRTGKMSKNIAGEIGESETTRASIDALKQMEAEEAERSLREAIEIDESYLDLSEQMGGRSIIATGEGGTKSVKLSSSIIPEADLIKNRAIKMVGDEVPDLSKDIFLDDNNEKNDLDFLES
jgi:hypothetical protein